MIRTLLTGATGRLGTALRPRLSAAGHDVRAASRSPPAATEADIDWVELDLGTEDGIESALENIDVVIHAATAPQGDTAAVDGRGTERLLEAAETAGVRNLVYPSIVGVDDVPLSYYEHKASAEAAVEASDVPTTIVRATQFHSFVAELLGYVAKLPVWPLPTRMRVQPVDVGDVADVIVENAVPAAGGRTHCVGGPEIQSVGELARAYRDARGLRRPIIRVPIPSKTVAAFRSGHAVCPDYRAGTVTWQEWLSEQYGSGVDEPNASVRLPT